MPPASQKINSEEASYAKILVTLLSKRCPTLIERDDLRLLVEVALKHEEITTSKAAELLGLTLEEMRVLSVFWYERWGKEEEKSNLEEIY